MKILFLIIILEYTITIGLPTVNNLSHIVAKKDLLSSVPFLIIFQLVAYLNYLLNQFKLFSLLAVVVTLFQMNLNSFVMRIIWYTMMSLKKLELIMI